jgi:hypothetical protein
MQLSARDSTTILVTLLILLGASVGVFAMLVRSLTTRRKSLALLQWAKNHQARLSNSSRQSLPDKLNFIRDFNPRLGMAIDARHWTVAELTTQGPPESKGRRPRWQLLAWEFSPDANAWQPTGLRPASHAVSLLDLFNLSSFPSLGGNDRFMVFGTDAATARALADSAAQTLLPADIGLLLHGHTLVMDFSSRPFDPIQLERVLALAQQLLPRLPRAGSSSAGLQGAARSAR